MYKKTLATLRKRNGEQDPDATMLYTSEEIQVTNNMNVEEIIIGVLDGKTTLKDIGTTIKELGTFAPAIIQKHNAVIRENKESFGLVD